MNVERNVLAVIPARGGSKGIPRKNMRLMHGRPLIDYAISCAAESSCITDVAVSTDSREILDFVEQIDGVVALERSPELSGDDITLDPVVNDAVVRVEALRGVRYDIVITMQPTSPLLTVRTLDTAIERFLNSDSDTMVSATNAPHLSWGKTVGIVLFRITNDVSIDRSFRRTMLKPVHFWFRSVRVSGLRLA